MTTFYLQDVEIDPETNSITKNGVRKKVEPKIMQVLLCLVEAKGRVVTKDDLLQKVWAETVVVEMVLTRAISELRSAFGDKSTNPQFIETISKSGYRLVADIQTSVADQPKRKISKVMIPLAIIGLMAIAALQLLPSSNLPATSTTFLTTDKGWEFHPALSPDNKWVVHVAQTTNDFSDLYIKSLTTDSTIKVTNSNGLYLKPTWSPDGKLIAAFSKRDTTAGIDIYSVSDLALQKRIPIKTQFAGLAWSPAGDNISFVAKDPASGRHSLFEYSLETGTYTLQVESQPGSWGDSDPRYSPDGSTLAFIRTIAEGNEDIYKMDLATATIRRLTTINRGITGYDWEDDNTLLVSSSYQGCGDLWKVNANGDSAEPKKFLKIPYGESIQNPEVTDGLLVGERWLEDTDLLTSTLTATSNPSNVPINSSQWELHPHFSPDGDWLAFSSNRSGNYEIWKLKLSSGDLKKLTNIGSGFRGKPRWSPDGSKMAFESNEGGNNRIYVMGTSGDELTPITPADVDYINPSWSLDGNFIYTASNESTDWNIYKIPVSGGQPTQVTDFGAYHLLEVPGSKAAIVTNINEDGIWMLNADGTKEKIVESLTAPDWGNLQVTAEGIYYLNRKSKSLDFYSFTDEKSAMAISIDARLPSGDPSLAIHPTLAYFLYGHITSYSGDIVAIRNY